MDGQTYQIKLNINVDDSQLSKAERRIRDLERGPGAGRGGSMAGSGGGSYSNIPARQQAYYRALSRRFGRTPGLSNEGFLSNVNRLYHRSKVFKRAFLGNMATLPGMLRNLYNFGSVLGSIGRIAGGVVKPLGAFASALSTLGGAFIAYKGVQGFLRGGALMLGTRIMNSAAMQEAGSSLMQFSMAKKGLGAAYERSLEESTRLAAEYGFSRTGILNSINMLSGLNVGSRTLSREEAVRIATQAGKIAHVGGVPFERVNINLQQLLGQPTPSARDLRELIQAAPIIGKIAQQSMARKKVSGHVFTYLKDKAELLNVLNEFDRMIESNPLMKSRGRVALARENFHIEVANQGTEFWEAIASGNEKLYAALTRSITYAFSKVDPAWVEKQFSALADTVESGLKSIVQFFDTVGPAISATSKAAGWVFDKAVGKRNWGVQTIVRLSSALGNVIVGNSPIFHYYTPTFNPETGKVVEGDYTSKFGRSLRWEEKSRKAATTAARQAKEYTLQKAGIPREEWKKYLNDPTSWKELGAETRMFPTGYELTPEALARLNPASGLDGNGANFSASDGLSDITKGARSLIINFNREIVSMPISIDNVNDGADLGAQLQGALYDNIMRGLQVALNHATGAM